MDKIILSGKLDKFCRQLELETNASDRYRYNIGYKYARVYVDHGNREPPEHRYFVDTRSADIYASKSWTQANPRRWYGTLDTTRDWHWAYHPATVLPGTPSEKEYHRREAEIKESYQKRGRKPKV